MSFIIPELVSCKSSIRKQKDANKKALSFISKQPPLRCSCSLECCFRQLPIDKLRPNIHFMPWLVCRFYFSLFHVFWLKHNTRTAYLSWVSERFRSGLMAPAVEANSLSDITQLASYPPKYPRNPTEKKRQPLTLYIARVPGSRGTLFDLRAWISGIGFWHIE